MVKEGSENWTELIIRHDVVNVWYYKLGLSDLTEFIAYDIGFGSSSSVFV